MLRSEAKERQKTLLINYCKYGLKQAMDTGLQVISKVWLKKYVFENIGQRPLLIHNMRKSKFCQMRISSPEFRRLKLTNLTSELWGMAGWQKILIVGKGNSKREYFFDHTKSSPETLCFKLTQFRKQHEEIIHT